MVELKSADISPRPADPEASLTMKVKSIHGHVYVFKIPRGLALGLQVHLDAALRGSDLGSES